MMPPKERRHYRLPFDVLSNLPDNVIDVILVRLPCKDAVRTSVLSKKWRYNWCRLTELTLDSFLWTGDKDILDPTNRFAKIIYQLLTHHEGPITKFKLDIAYLQRCPKIDNFIYFLSRKDIQHLVLHLPQKKDELYKLPSSLFLCLQLRHLNLHNCIIHPPSAFEGFDRLISLELRGVTISSELLGHLISHCLLLEQLVLNISATLNILEINAPMLRSFDFNGSISSLCLKNVPLLAKASLIHKSSKEAENFDYAKFFESCSALGHLDLYLGHRELFADEAPTRLRLDLNHVKRFYLSSFLLEESYKLSCVLCLIRSFPNLEYLQIEVHNDYDIPALECLEMESFSDVTFNHLREVKLASFGRTKPGMQLIKLLLAKSPVLVRMVIYPVFFADGDETFSDPEVNLLAKLENVSRASPKVDIRVVL